MLQRSANLTFKTVTGILSSPEALVADDTFDTYKIESRSSRLIELVGRRVELKGLVDMRTEGERKIHLISAGGLS